MKSNKYKFPECVFFFFNDTATTEIYPLSHHDALPIGEARAGGELGTIAFLDGEVFTALKMVARAYLRAEMYGDIAAQMKQLAALGEGLAEFGRPADATDRKSTRL